MFNKCISSVLLAERPCFIKQITCGTRLKTELVSYSVAEAQEDKGREGWRGREQTERAKEKSSLSPPSFYFDGVFSFCRICTVAVTREMLTGLYIGITIPALTGR